MGMDVFQRSAKWKPVDTLKTKLSVIHNILETSLHTTNLTEILISGDSSKPIR